jgi:hypothetical protein
MLTLFRCTLSLKNCTVKLLYQIKILDFFYTQHDLFQEENNCTSQKGHFLDFVTPNAILGRNHSKYRKMPFLKDSKNNFSNATPYDAYQ